MSNNEQKRVLVLGEPNHPFAQKVLQERFPQHELIFRPLDRATGWDAIVGFAPDASLVEFVPSLKVTNLQREGFDSSFFVEDYLRLLDRCLETQAYRETPFDQDDLMNLAQKLGGKGATPRDVVEIHTKALARKNNPENPAKYIAYAEEGRLLLLELMGYLAGYYRKQLFRKATGGGQ